MNEIVRIHDLLHEELNGDHTVLVYESRNFAHELSLIGAWQMRTLTQATKQIAQEADRARNIVHQIIEENRHRIVANEIALSEDFERLKKRLTMLSEQLHVRTKTNDYLEPDLHQWDNELSSIRILSLAPPVWKHVIINKLVFKEIRQIKIDISNILDIDYEDANRTKALNYEYQAKYLVETVKEKVSEAGNYAKKSQKPGDRYQAKTSVEELVDQGWASPSQKSDSTRLEKWLDSPIPVLNNKEIDPYYRVNYGQIYHQLSFSCCVYSQGNIPNSQITFGSSI
jgi:hypothetical protein